MIKNENKIAEEVRNVNEKLKARSFSDYVDVFTIIVVVIMFASMIVAFLVNFVFTLEINLQQIAVDAVLISACTTAIYLMVRAYAMRKGRKTELWKKAEEEVQKSGKAIRDSGAAKYIPKYCRAWEEERYVETVSGVLGAVGITYEEFKEKYSKLSIKEIKRGGFDLTDFQLKAVIKAKRVKRLKFNERYFYGNAESSHGRTRSPSSGLTARQINNLTAGRIVLTSILTSFLSATLLYDVVFNFSVEAVIQCIIKITITIFFGAVGMLGGYNHAVVREVNEMKAKSDDIQDLLKWCEEQKPADNFQN